MGFIFVLPYCTEMVGLFCLVEFYRYDLQSKTVLVVYYTLAEHNRVIIFEKHNITFLIAISGNRTEDLNILFFLRLILYYLLLCSFLVPSLINASELTLTQKEKKFVNGFTWDELRNMATDLSRDTFCNRSRFFD